MTAKTTSREQEIKTIWKDYAFFYKVLGGVMLVGIGVLIGLIWFASDVDRSAYVVNLYTTFLGVIITVFVLDLLNRRRDEQRAVKDLQAQLIRDAGSTSNEIAKNGIHQLRKRGWLTSENGLLRQADLKGANLAGADLTDANLQKVNLMGTNLQESILIKVDLRGASMEHTNLQDAKLWRANLQDALMGGAHLQGASIGRRNPTIMNEDTILPDGNHWTTDTDLTEFGVIFED